MRCLISCFAFSAEEHAHRFDMDIITYTCWYLMVLLSISAEIASKIFLQLEEPADDMPLTEILKRSVHHLLTTRWRADIVRTGVRFSRESRPLRTVPYINKEDEMIECSAMLRNVVERLTPGSDDVASEPTWRFSERMAAVYELQMRRFLEDQEASQWKQLYSTENMPPPDDTDNMAQVAAQMAFYFPTHVFKFQKAAIQQLLEWHSQHGQVNPYPFGAPTITLIDIGAGVGTATLAMIDLLATWADVAAELGYKQLGISVKPIVVEPDRNKREARQHMLSHLSRLLDAHSIRSEPATEIFELYPGPECIEQIQRSVRGGSLLMCCISNFLSSVPFDGERAGVTAAVEAASDPTGTIEPFAYISPEQAAELADKAARCAEAANQILSRSPARSKLLLASEVDEQGRTLRSFAKSLQPYLEMLVRRNRVRFYSPVGCYWHSPQDGDKPVDPYCAVNFWSVADWVAGTPSLIG